MTSVENKCNSIISAMLNHSINTMRDIRSWRWSGDFPIQPPTLSSSDITKLHWALIKEIDFANSYECERSTSEYVQEGKKYMQTRILDLPWREEMEWRVANLNHAFMPPPVNMTTASYWATME